MRVYKCIITGDEMFSDSYPIKEEGGFYVLKGKYVNRKGESVDDSMIGGNPSAEEAAEDSEEGNEAGIDVVLDSRLQETGFGNKKEYTAYMKDFMKAAVEKLKEKRSPSEDEVTAAKALATEAVKIALGKFKDLQFYQGASMDAAGHIALMEWKDEEVDGKTVNTPFLYFYKLGLLDEKV